MIFHLILTSFCIRSNKGTESTVVKIIHESGSNKKSPIMPQGDNIVGATSLKDKNTEWVISREKGQKDNFVEISPMVEQDKRMIVDNEGNLKLEKKDNGMKKWEVKEVNKHHLLSYGNKCLSMDDDLNLTAKNCNPEDLEQRFLVTSRDKRKREKRPKHDHKSDETTEYEYTTESEHEADHHVMYIPGSFSLKSELVPNQEAEDVHYTVTSTEVVKSVLTLSDTTLKTIYETKTEFVTSTATETKSLDYTRTITSTTVSTQVITTTIEEKAPRKKRSLDDMMMADAPQYKEPKKRKHEESELKKSENIKDSVELISTLLDSPKFAEQTFDAGSNSIPDFYNQFENNKENDIFTPSSSGPNIFKDDKENCKPAICQQPLLIDMRNFTANPQVKQPTNGTIQCCPPSNLAVLPHQPTQGSYSHR